jgi:hypothetical protein
VTVICAPALALRPFSTVFGSLSSGGAGVAFSPFATI